MKNKNTLLLLIGTLALVSLAACAPVAGSPAVSGESPAGEANVPAMDDAGADLPAVASVDDEGATSVDQSALSAAVGAYPVGDLGDDEVADLRYMREEEKLAHDVYLALYDLWGIPVFQNIAASEQTHTEAVKTLIDRYGIEDPAVGNALGVFVDPDLQALYDDLVATGSLSLGDALKVGAAIEEIDILDLEESIARTDNADIILVYENLLQGSRNHLRAFVSTFERQTGETYVPRYMDQAAYEAIISEGIERGNPGGGAGGGGRGNGRGGNG